MIFDTSFTGNGIKANPHKENRECNLSHTISVHS